MFKTNGSLPGHGNCNITWAPNVTNCNCHSYYGQEFFYIISESFGLGKQETEKDKAKTSSAL